MSHHSSCNEYDKQLGYFCEQCGEFEPLDIKPGKIEFNQNTPLSDPDKVAEMAMMKLANRRMKMTARINWDKVWKQIDSEVPALQQLTPFYKALIQLRVEAELRRKG